jgi:hypothetical protein
VAFLAKMFFIIFDFVSVAFLKEKIIFLLGFALKCREPSEVPPPVCSEQNITKKFSFSFRRKNPARAK